MKTYYTYRVVDSKLYPDSFGYVGVTSDLKRSAKDHGKTLDHPDFEILETITDFEIAGTIKRLDNIDQAESEKKDSE